VVAIEGAIPYKSTPHLVGAARNLLRGTRGVWGLDGSSSAGSMGRDPVQGHSPDGGLGAKPQKSETHANFQLRREHASMSPLGSATVT